MLWTVPGVVGLLYPLVKLLLVFTVMDSPDLQCHVWYNGGIVMGGEEQQNIFCLPQPHLFCTGHVPTYSFSYLLTDRFLCLQQWNSPGKNGIFSLYCWIISASFCINCHQKGLFRFVLYPMICYFCQGFNDSLMRPDFLAKLKSWAILSTIHQPFLESTIWKSLVPGISASMECSTLCTNPLCTFGR